MVELDEGDEGGAELQAEGGRTRMGNDRRSGFLRAVVVATSVAAVIGFGFPEVAAADTAPVITQQPVSVVASPSAVVHMFAAASGVPTPTVQWKKLDCTLFCTQTTVSGATSTTLTLTAPASQTGLVYYFATFTNAAGTVNSTQAQLEVRRLPVVTPTTATTLDFALGSTRTLSASVTAGIPAPTVQWQQSDDGTTWSDVAGGQNSTLSVGPLTAEFNGRRFRMVATNVVGTATTGVTTFAQSTAPSITTQPASTVSGNENTSATLTVAATGSPTPTIQWQRSSDGGTTWTNSNTGSSAVVGFSKSNNGWKYRAIASNVGGSVTSSETTVVSLWAPYLVTCCNPTLTPTTVAPGGTATLAIDISGNPTVGFQWKRKRAGDASYSDIPGATTSTYSFQAVALDNNATFQVTATNSLGTSTYGSPAPTLTVLSQPTVTTQPVDRTVAVGGSTSVFAVSSVTATSQWQISTDAGTTWTNIAGQTTNSLSLSNVSLSQSGNLYRNIFTNIAGSVATNPALLTVDSPPTVVDDPQGQSVSVGDTATFSATAGGATSAQWQRTTNGGTNWFNVSGGTFTAIDGTATFPVTNATIAMNGWQYRVVFTRTVATVTSAPASLSVSGVATIGTQPASTFAGAGATVTLTSTASSSEPASTLWERSDDSGATWTAAPGGTAVTSSGVTTASLPVGPLTMADYGSKFRVTFTNASGAVTSSVSTVTVLGIAAQPADATAALSATATFTAVATQTASVVWESSPNGVTYSSVSGSSATLSVVATAANNGRYYRATFFTGTATVRSNTARLTVTSAAPGITSSPTSVSGPVGDSVTFSATGFGPTSPTAAWEQSTNSGSTWTPVTAGSVTSTNPDASSTVSTLTVGVTTAFQVRFRASFSNASGTTVSGSAILYNVNVTTQPTNVATTPGSSVSFAAGAANASLVWQVSTDGGASFTDISPSVSTSPLSLTATPAMNGNRYRAKFSSNPATPAFILFSDAATLTVDSGASPQIVSYTDNGLVNRTLTAVASSELLPTSFWERSTDGGTTWETLAPSTTTWSGSTLTSTYSFTFSVATSGTYRAGFTNANGTTRTTTKSMQADFPVAFVTQPVDVSTTHGGIATFVASNTASPTPYGWDWEYSTDGSNWTSLTSPNGTGVVSPLLGGGPCGITSCSLQATMSSPHLFVREKLTQLYASSTVTVYSNVARLDVSGAPVSSQGDVMWPVSPGASVKLIRQAYSGSPITSVAWERSTNDGATWTAVGAGSIVPLQSPSEFRSELSIVPAGTDNFAKFRAIFSNAAGSTTSGVITLDTNYPTVTSSPADVTATSGNSASFSVAGNYYSSVSWQRSNNGGSTWTTVSGATSSSYSLTTASTDNGARFRAQLVSSGGTALSNEAVLTVNFLPTITTQPANASSAGLAPVSFNAVATGNPTPTVKWQVSTNGGTSYSDIAGATTNPLIITPTGAAMSGYRYRAIFSNAVGTRTSNAATLTVNAVPQTISFAAEPPTSGEVDSTFPVAATASSGLTVGIGVTGSCSLAAGLVTLTSVGSCTVTASQAGNATYAAAPLQERTVVVSKMAQTLTFGALPVAPAVGSTFTVSATASSGLPVSFGASGACSILDRTVTIVGSGLCSVTASQAGDAVWSIAPDVTRTTTVKAGQTISFPALPLAPAVGSSVAAGASASSGLAVALTASGGCSVIGTTVRFTSAEVVCAVTARQPGSSAFNAAAPVVQTTTAVQGPQSITFAAMPASVAVGATFSILPKASSGLAVSLGASGGCSVSGLVVTATSSGICTIVASQAGDSSWSAAPDVTRTTVVRSDQSISFGTLPASPTVGSSFIVSGVASSGLTVSYVATGGCTVVNATVRFTTAGVLCTVTARQAGNSNFNAAVEVAQTTTAIQGPQTIAFLALPASVVPGAVFTVSAVASSGLPVALSTSGVCSVAGSTVTMTGAGSCSITASQGGNANWLAAVSVTRSTLVKADQTISFAALPSAPAVGSVFVAGATSSSGLTVSYIASGGCTVAGTTVRFTAVGVLCTVTARQAGNATFNAALEVVRTTTAVQGPQTITFSAPPASVAPGSSFVVSAVASSGLPVNLVVSGVCSISGSTVTMTGTGLCSMTASQSGNASWSAAPDVTRTTAVKANQTISFGALPVAPAVGTSFLAGATSTSGLTIAYAATGGCTAVNGVVRFTTAGSLCTVTAKQLGNSLFNAAIEVVQTATPVQGPQSIVFNAFPQDLLVGATFNLVASATSALPVSFAVSGGCDLVGVVITITATGPCTVTASQGGNSNWAAAANYVRTTSARSVQTITFDPLPVAPAAGSSVVVSAVSSSGATVALNATGACSLVGALLKFSAAGGLCTVTASQAGNALFRPATAVVQSTTAIV